MKLEARDFNKLRWQLLIAAGALIAGGILAYAGLAFEQHAEQQHRATKARQEQIENKLKQVRNEEQEIRSKSALFLQLQERAILGPEKRLYWSEMLADLQKTLRLPGMEYEFSPQTELEGTAAGGYAFYKSTMKVRLSLVHEEDLFRFLQRLETQASALTVPSNCKIERLPAQAPERSDSLAQLSANCEIDWITARPSTGK